jgi:hypothetical protein
MKKCDHFKDLILTDYIDGQLGKGMAENLESHLLDCGDCRAFFKEIKNNVTAPLQQATRQPVPSELWSTIKQNIELKNQATSPITDLVERIKGLFIFPRLIPILASCILMFLAGSVTLNTIHLQQVKDQDQGEYLVSLLSPTGTATAADNNDGGTPIEHYFL